MYIYIYTYITGTPDAYTLKTPELLSDLNQLTITLDFALASLDNPMWILVGGSMLRWLGVKVDTEGNMLVTFNNQDVHVPLHGLQLAAYTWTSFVLGIDVNEVTLITLIILMTISNPDIPNNPFQ